MPKPRYNVSEVKSAIRPFHVNVPDADVFIEVRRDDDKLPKAA